MNVKLKLFIISWAIELIANSILSHIADIFAKRDLFFVCFIIHLQQMNEWCWMLALPLLSHWNITCCHEWMSVCLFDLKIAFPVFHYITIYSTAVCMALFQFTLLFVTLDCSIHPTYIYTEISKMPCMSAA